MCLAAGQHIIGHNLFERLGISAISAKLIRESWESEPPSIYGRFDLAFDGSQVKILEYNADTPTCLLEASVVQWNWLRDNFPHADQFNSIHDRLIAKWKELLQYCGSRLYFACLRGPTTEDVMTVTYLADTAVQAGHEVRLLEMKQIGHDGRRFVTPDNQPIRSIFKLYPWEWMVGEEFGSRLEQARLSTDWIEPIWKMMFSNKGILPILWNMFQYDDLLLPAFFEDDYRKESLTEYCRKPLLGREGKNVSLHTATGDSGRDGENDGRGYIYQAIAAIPEFNGRFPVIGSWVIDGESAGIGIRESASQITDNTSRFVPHLFIPNVEPSA
jgi:glutathionylspermidine synthase